MKKYYIITLLVLTLSSLFSIIPQVSEIAITSDSENVIVNYALDADGQCQVVLVASDDAGATFRIYPTNLTGDVGNYVSPGDSKQITWNYTQDNIEAGDNFQIKLIARDNPYPAEDNNNFLSFTKVEGGTFHNGTADVTLSTFFMDKYETTQGEYEAVVGTNPSHHSGASKPVERTSWFDALKYCNIRSLQEGLIPCYDYNNQGLDPYEWSVENLSDSDFSFDFGANGYRLPTEMEWMFAAKGGNEEPPTGYNQWPGTDNSEDLGDYAWGSFNAGSETHPVASKLPNQLYLYDMAGNVREWCWDANGNYASDAQTNPIGPDADLTRIIRGGDYGTNATNLNLTHRYSEIAILNFLSIGFRSVRRMEDSPLEVTPTPIISPEAGSYNSAQEITISSGFGRSNIYYTLDGSYPDLNSTLYMAPITISETTTIKARAYRDGYQPSEVLTAEYEITIMPENFILVESGTFHNGYGDVTLSSFYMDKYEITQAEYVSVVGTNPSSFTGDNNPVEQVSWFDAIKYCNLRSVQKGLTPCYDYNGEGTDPNGWSDGWNNDNNQTSYSCNFLADGYRLPTEMEWMYAAKGGKLTNKVTYSSWSGTNDFAELGDYAWYASNATVTSHPVGTKEANELGLYDMSGNVFEWCWDMYEAYNPEAQINPLGSDSNGYRIYRGGSWYSGANNCKLTVRWRLDPPGESQNFLGFRVVRRLDNTVPQITPTPSITPEPGSYSTEQTIQLSLSGNDRPAIYYTLDGSYPNLASTQYFTPFTISDTTTVKAIAYIEGYQPSEVVTVVYNIESPPENFVFVEGGTFNNSTADITISDFYLSKFEVTQAEYEAVMGNNPSYSSGDNKPVEQVTWYNAVEYCNTRSIQEGLTPCYDTSDWSYDFSANGYRLPTEMEWMYAAKGGNQQPAIGYNQWSGTNVEAELTNYAWYIGNNSGLASREVGTKLSNQLGLHDMSGNVFEWCNDWHGNYTEGPQIDPVGPTTGFNRIIRGGSWFFSADTCMVTYRDFVSPSDIYSNVGFRIARSLN